MANKKGNARQVRGILGLVAVITTVAVSTSLDWFESKIRIPSSGGGGENNNNSKSDSTTTKGTEVVTVVEQDTIVVRPARTLTTPSHLLVPSSTEIISTHNGAFVSSYNTRLRNPNWSCVRLTPARSHQQEEEEEEAVSRTKSRFKEDSMIPTPFRTKPDDFLRSGLDRGHLTAAADVANSQQHMDESFLMSNISPQVGVGMNRHFWQLLESFCRTLTTKFEHVHVCTGPLFLPQLNLETQQWEVKYQVIGPRHDIAVPTHFFKCVHASNATEPAQQACFLVPNRAIDLKQEPLQRFIVSKDEVERLAGFEMFQRKPTEKPAQMLCDQVKCQLAKEAVYGGK